MGKASSSKKVARAASTGGGRTAGGRIAWGYYGTLTAIVAVLSLVLVLSVADYRDSDAFADDSPPQRDDHWHAVYGVYVCDEFVGEWADERDPKGIHTHADGVIHIHPFVRSAMGKNATLGVFFDAVRADLTRTSFEAPDGEKYENGDKCGEKEGEVQIWRNGTRFEGDPRKMKLEDRDNVVVAFVPPGTEVPLAPNAEEKLNNLTDLPPTSTTLGSAEVTVPLDSSTSVPGDTSTTAPAGDTSTTVTPTTSAPATTTP